MKIFNTADKELKKPEEWQRDDGRLLPGSKPDELVFTTWTEKPDKDAQGNVIDHSAQPDQTERIQANEDAIAGLMKMIAALQTGGTN